MTDGHRPQVLLIDDDSHVRESVASLLALFGYDCQTAADGVTGLTRFDEGGWDLVLTDLAMPDMSGWEVAEAIRRRSSTMPIVLITGLADPKVMRRAGEQGWPVIPKPFTTETLRLVVANVYQPGLSGHSGSAHRTEFMRPANLAEKRLQEIDDWWEIGFLGAFARASNHEEPVRLAFREVLQALSDEEFARFIAVEPQVVCERGLHGSVFRSFVSALLKKRAANVTVIYLGPVLARLNDSGLRDLVAVEVAHVLLDHFDQDHRSGPADDAAAAALATSWGFRQSAFGRRSELGSEHPRPPFPHGFTFRGSNGDVEIHGSRRGDFPRTRNLPTSPVILPKASE
jgi:CheY-like chemotaxis protein